MFRERTVLGFPYFSTFMLLNLQLMNSEFDYSLKDGKDWGRANVRLRIFKARLIAETNHISTLLIFFPFFSCSCLQQIIEKRQSMCEVTYLEAKKKTF
jgi:hypothetical protein